MKLRLTWVLGIIAGAALVYGGWLAWCAHKDWVTLNVRNMEVRQVVKKIARQTRETILVHSNVHGNVTLNVRRAHLEDVLRLVAQQTSSRSEKLYPLYSKSRSLDLLKRGLKGELNPVDHGWTNVQARGFFRGGPGGPFGGGPFGMGNQATPQKISLQIENKELAFATLALNRFGQLRVVPEDGAFPMVSLILNEATPSQAVKALAKKVDRSWTRLYALTGDFGLGGPGGPRNFAVRPRPNTSSEVAGNTNELRPRRFEMAQEQRDEFLRRQQALEAELVSVLPAKEQARLQQAQQERERQFQEMENMTPEERRAQFGRMSGGMDRMNRDRIRNSTQEQRVEQTRRMLEMRARMQEMQQNQPPTPTGR